MAKTRSNAKKDQQLGMSHGTAVHRLRKTIMFTLIVALKLNICNQCGEIIETERELSTEHVIPWLDSRDPKGLFFDVNNIRFSHLSCNSAASRSYKGMRKTTDHGITRYETYGCRCEICKSAKSVAHLKSRIRTGRKKS